MYRHLVSSNRNAVILRYPKKKKKKKKLKSETENYLFENFDFIKKLLEIFLIILKMKLLIMLK